MSGLKKIVMDLFIYVIFSRQIHLVLSFMFGRVDEGVCGDFNVILHL